MPPSSKSGRSRPTPELSEQRKARFSDDEDYSDDDGDEAGSMTPSSRYSSRSPPSRVERASRSHPVARSHAYRQPKSTGRRYRRIGGLYFYRIPNRTARYLAVIIITSLAIFILSLIRASQVENWKILNGKIDMTDKRPPEYAWMSFPEMMRYYGGIDTLVPKSKNKPEYPPRETAPTGEKPAVEARADEASAQSHSSRPYEQHPQAILRPEADASECFIDADGTVKVPPIRYYDGRPFGFPNNAVGSYEQLNMPDDICFERYGRYGPYGFGYSIRNGGMGTGQYGHRNGSESVFESIPPVDYRKVNWADVQRRCFHANAHRFKPIPPSPPPIPGFYVNGHAQIPELESTTLADDKASGSERPVGDPNIENKDQSKDGPLEVGQHQDIKAAAERDVKAETDTKAKGETKDEAKTTTKPNIKPEPEPEPEPKAKDGKLPRTAIVVRVWDEYIWREDDVMNLRSIIAETSLASHGRYDVHLLVQVKNEAAHPILADSDAFKRRLDESIPAEFRGLVTFWTETQMLSLYQGIFDLWVEGPDLPVHGSFRGLSMAIMYFARNHPEYDYFWQWEMDARYIGHHLDLFTKLGNWARDQPRKGMWERNERFFVPEAHGSWEEFKQLAKIQGEMDAPRAESYWGVGSEDRTPDKMSESGKLVWGPQRPSDESDWFEPENDPRPPKDTSSDQDRYEWGVGEEADLISLYPIYDPVGTTWRLRDDITGYNTRLRDVPRRAHINVSSRVSRRLLLLMHRETAVRKHFAFPEMWQATVAFQHGLKAVAAPQPMFNNRKWPPKFLALTYNAGKKGASGGARTSVFGQREHNLEGLSWFYRTAFAPTLYHRWLGIRFGDAGGEEFELVADPSKAGESLPGGEGRMCLPPMLLHPVKEVMLPVEVLPVEEQEEEAQTENADDVALDPAA